MYAHLIFVTWKQPNRKNFLAIQIHNSRTYNLVQLFLVKLLNGKISYSNSLFHQLPELKHEYVAPSIAPIIYGIPDNYSNLQFKFLNCDLLGVCTKIGWGCFLISLQNRLIIFYSVFLWTLHMSLMFCNSSPLPNLCNDIAILSCTETITLERVSTFFKYGPNLSHKKLNVVYVTLVRFLNSFSVHERNNNQYMNSYIRSCFHMFLSLCPIFL